ncbi:hypothetical protein RI129_007364 [Pyrocoelia pectoralis]|uniref:Ig-like domain-containing protein n=1 Tax=Pyrocoelia pectoralis TaxID=417401 RepID=A0AAN7VHQ2_9COLE
MKFLILLVVTVWVHHTNCRLLSDDLDNNILANPVGLGMASVIQRDWVRISQSPPQIVSRPLGSRIELECEAMGSPAPIMQWLKGNTPLTENESFETNSIDENRLQGTAKTKSRLIINSALPIHEGTFTCLAESGSQIASTKTNLYVVHRGISEKNFTKLFADGLLGTRTPARIVLFNTIYLDNIGRVGHGTYSTIITVNLTGSNIELPCKAIGNPTPDLIWLDPSERVVTTTSDSRISVLQNGELSIRGIKWDDMGVYTCVARNSLERDSISTFLYPMLTEQ